LSFSLHIGTTGSPVPHRSLIRVLAVFMPGASGALRRSRPHLIPQPSLHRGLDASWVISTRHQRFTLVQLHGSHLTRSTPRLFHRRSPPGLFTPAARGGLKPAPGKPAPGGLPPSSTKHRTLLYSPFSSNVRSGHTVMPNPSLKGSTNGMPPGPGHRYGVHCLRPGPGVLPLAPA
jgi:hypothetical protein